MLILAIGTPIVAVAPIVLALSLRIVKQYELGVLFRLRELPILRMQIPTVFARAGETGALKVILSRDS